MWGDVMAKTKIQNVPVDQAKAIMYLDEKLLRKMYTQYRDIAQKRLKRMEQEGFGWTTSVRSHAKGFAKLRDIDKRDLPKAFSELSKFVSAKTSSVTGQRSRMNKTIKAWNKQGIALNEKNYRTVMEILENLRDRKKVYGSDDITEAANKILEFTPDIQQALLNNIDKVMDNIDTFVGIPDMQGISADDVLNLLG